MTAVGVCPSWCGGRHDDDSGFHLSIPYAEATDKVLGGQLAVELVRNDLPGLVDGPYVDVTWALDADYPVDDSMSFDVPAACELADALICHATAGKAGTAVTVNAHLPGRWIEVAWSNHPRLGAHVHVTYHAPGEGRHTQTLRLTLKDARDLGEGIQAACKATEEPK